MENPAAAQIPISTENARFARVLKDLLFFQVTEAQRQEFLRVSLDRLKLTPFQLNAYIIELWPHDNPPQLTESQNASINELMYWKIALWYSMLRRNLNSDQFRNGTPMYQREYLDRAFEEIGLHIGRDIDLINEIINRALVDRGFIPLLRIDLILPKLKGRTGSSLISKLRDPTASLRIIAFWQRLDVEVNWSLKELRDYAGAVLEALNPFIRTEDILLQHPADRFEFRELEIAYTT